MRAIPGISPLLRPLKNAVKTVFLLVLVKFHTLVEGERDRLALPPRLSGMGITSSEKLDDKNQNYIRLTRSLTNMIIVQVADGEMNQSEIRKIKRKLRGKPPRPEGRAGPSNSQSVKMCRKTNEA